jgi:hypothetical protein
MAFFRGWVDALMKSARRALARVPGYMKAWERGWRTACALQGYGGLCWVSNVRWPRV